MRKPGHVGLKSVRKSLVRLLHIRRLMTHALPALTSPCSACLRRLGLSGACRSSRRRRSTPERAPPREISKPRSSATTSTSRPTSGSSTSTSRSTRSISAARCRRCRCAGSRGWRRSARWRAATSRSKACSVASAAAPSSCFTRICCRTSRRSSARCRTRWCTRGCFSLATPPRSRPGVPRRTQAARRRGRVQRHRVDRR